VPQVLLRDFGMDLTAFWWVFALATVAFVAWLGYESIKYSLGWTSSSWPSRSW
jgi:hypothetical protein